MAEPARTPSQSNYEQDFAAWSEEQGRRLRARNVAGLDWDNLAEEIETLGRSERHEIRNRMSVLLHHLLKWEFQPEGRSGSWAASIIEQRMRIAEIVEASPSLRGFPGKVLESEYRLARLKAAGETGLPLDRFPATAPYTIEQALDDGFMPGQPWSPEELR